MTSHIASRISRTRWKTYFSAEQLYQHLYDAGAVMKRLVIFAGSRKCPEKSRANYLKQSAEDQFLCICG